MNRLKAPGKLDYGDRNLFQAIGFITLDANEMYVIVVMMSILALLFTQAV
jgi:hypothetical protein